MEDFSNVYTVEYNGTKGWEVVNTFFTLTDAVNDFRSRLINNDGQYRLTSPGNPATD